MSTDLRELKTRQQRMWGSGDYGKVAWLTVPLAEHLVETVDLSAGATVLDVATGTGHVALAAARRFCHVTGIDYVPELLEVARGRAAAEGLDVDFREADAEQLPYGDGSFGYVLSAIGVMFAPDQRRAAAELARVCRHGGRIGLANWTPTGFIGEMLRLVGRHAPAPPGVSPPTRWGTVDGVRELLGDTVRELEFTTATVSQRLPSPEFFADFFLEHYGPTLAAAGRLTPPGRETFRADLVALARESNRAKDGTLVSDWEYLITTATRI